MLLGLQLCIGVGCSSTTENKAKDVEREQLEVNEALKAGKSQQEVVDEMADADSASEEFRQVWEKERDKLREQANTVIEEIDRKLAAYDRYAQSLNAAEQEPYKLAITDLKNHRARMSNLLLIIDKASATDWQQVKIEAENLTEYTNYKVDRISVD